MLAGEKAPDFTLSDHTGRPQTLSMLLSDGPVVLFFYPIASSPGCTAEACLFRDLANEFAAVGAQRVGISTDTVDKQAHFAQQRSFDYPLLSDEGGEVSELFGVRRGRLAKLGNSVKSGQAARHGRHSRRRGLLARLLPVKRTTFVIDTDRTVLKVVSSELRPTAHADQALWFLQNYKLSASSPPVWETHRNLDEKPTRLESYERSQTPIRIVEGDLFAQDGHLVIGTSDTFDTAVPHIVDRTSVQGIAVDRLYGNSVEKLDADLAAALRSVQPIGEVAKRGKTVRYPLGTVAVVDRPPRKLFFLAYTMMNERNNAQVTAGGLWTSLNSLWAAISEQANGGVVCMPVIGDDMSRSASIDPTEDSIRCAILSFMFATRSAKVCDELRIVVSPEDYQRLDQLELQAFLTSFRPS
jgi:peroxiredoxin